MSMSIALFIHAFIPNLLESYASEKMKEWKEYVEDVQWTWEKFPLMSKKANIT